MSTPYVGEIRLFGFPRIPNGWFACDGSLQSIAEYQTLYTLIGTAFGGDGQNTFGVPDLRGRIPIHQGQGLGLSAYVMGQVSGTEGVTLLTAQIPQHTHVMVASTTAASTNTPSPNVVLGTATGTDPDNLYVSYPGAPPAPIPFAATTVSVTGSTLPHENCMPTVTASYCIAWAGVFPSRS